MRKADAKGWERGWPTHPRLETKVKCVWLAAPCRCSFKNAATKEAEGGGGGGGKEQSIQVCVCACACACVRVCVCVCVCVCVWCW